MSDIPLLKPAVFLLGVPRSGTTLLRVMLAGHPQLFSPPEMVLAPFRTMAQRKEQMDQRFWEKGGLRRALMELRGLEVEDARRAVEAFQALSVPEVYAHLQEHLGERILVDKCPHLCAKPEALARVGQWFPESKFIWIVRNPGSVIRSVSNMPMAEVMLQGYADEPAKIWHSGNTTVERFLSEYVDKDRWVRVRYEDIVTSPREPLQQICETLGIPFNDALLDPYEGDRMREGPKGARAIGDPNMSGRGKVQPELATQWLEGFDHRSVDGDTKAMAKKFGYDLESIPLPPVTKISDALDELWNTVRELEQSIDLPQDIDAIEGRRFLVRMLQASLDTFTEWSDVDRPKFHHAESPHRKMFADCPDADYLRAAIQLGEGRQYHLTGRIPDDCTYLGVLLYGKGGRVGARVVDRTMERDKQGRFTVCITADEPKSPAKGTTLLQGDTDTTAVIVRQYYKDRTRQRPADLAIQLAGEVPPPRPLDPLAFAQGVSRAKRMLKTVFNRTLEGYQMASSMALKRFIPIDAEQFFPTPDNAYQICWYRIGYNQVMLVRGKIPSARYFSFTLYNAWMESLDYEHRRVHLNDSQINANANGEFELCLAHRDLGHVNWLDTEGHHAGYLIARSLLPEGESPSFETQTMYETEYEDQRAQRS